MAWNDREWAAFAAILRLGFPGDFTADEDEVYRLMLTNIDSRDAMAGLEEWTETFRPSVGDLRRIAKPHAHARAQREWAEAATERLRLKHLALEAGPEKNAALGEFKPDKETT